MSVSSVFTAVATVLACIVAIVTVIGQEAGCVANTSVVGAWLGENDDVTMVFMFNRDGTVAYEGPGPDGDDVMFSGTYTVEGSTISLEWNYDIMGDATICFFQCAEYSVADSTMALSISGMYTNASAASSDCGAVGPVTFTRQTV